jgi:hypothetical protein
VDHFCIIDNAPLAEVPHQLIDPLVRDKAFEPPEDVLGGVDWNLSVVILVENREGANQFLVYICPSQKVIDDNHKVGRGPQRPTASSVNTTPTRRNTFARAAFPARKGFVRQASNVCVKKTSYSSIRDFLHQATTQTQAELDQTCCSDWRFHIRIFFSSHPECHVQIVRYRLHHDCNQEICGICPAEAELCSDFLGDFVIYPVARETEPANSKGGDALSNGFSTLKRKLSAIWM